MKRNNIYTLTGTKTLDSVAHALEHYMRMYMKMECQILTASNGCLLVQARGKHDSVKQWVGLDKAITVKLTPLHGNTFQMDIGQSQWLKKGVVMAVALLLLWPLAVTPGVGIVMQTQLPYQIEQALQRYLADLPMTGKKINREKSA